MGAVTTTWTVKVFDVAGDELATMEQAITPGLSYPLNGVDSFNCTFYLDDPQLDPNHLADDGSPDPGDPTLIREIDRVLKVWREIYDDTDPLNIIHYKDPDGTPAFCGHIMHVEKQGAAGQMNVIAQCPYWRLMSRFHLLNHFLVIDTAAALSGAAEGGNNDDMIWDVSALCFRLVDLVNHAFGADSATGIVKPTAGPPYWPKTQAVHGGYRVAKGNNVWIEIQELLWNTDDVTPTPDLVPEYIDQSSGNPADLMYFKTAVHRGADVSAYVKFNYCMSSADPTLINNLDDFIETADITTDDNGGSFANYVWAVGQAGPQVAARVASNPGGPPTTPDPALGYDQVGIYMYYSEAAAWADKVSNPFIQRFANSVLITRNTEPKVYQVTPSPLVKPYYITSSEGVLSGDDSSFFTLGDVAEFNANKGALQVSGLQHRIYEVVLNQSENCVESTQIRIAPDFLSKVPLTP